MITSWSKTFYKNEENMEHYDKMRGNNLLYEDSFRNAALWSLTSYDFLYFMDWYSIWIEICSQMENKILK